MKSKRLGVLVGLSILLSVGSNSSIAVGEIAATEVAAPVPTTQPAGITPVNLKLQQALPEDVFFMLGKAGGVRFTANGDVWNQDMMQVPNDVDFADRPFWSAVRDVCTLWHVALQPNNNGNNNRRLVMNVSQQPTAANSNWQPVPYCISQGFLIEAVSFNRQQNINYNTPQQTANSCSVQFRVYADPAMKISSFSSNVRVDEAVDDAGHSMMPDRGSVSYCGGGSNQRTLIYDATAQMKYPDNAGKKISHLKGELIIRGDVVADTMTIEKPLTARGETKKFGDIAITFKSMKKSGNSNYEAQVTIVRDGDENNSWNDNWQLVQSAQLLDEKGRPWGFGGGGGGGGGNGRYNYSANYYSPGGNREDDANPSGDPAKWQIELPRNSHAMHIPFEFTDLTLP